MAATPGLVCRVPIRIRLFGEPTEEDLAGLEAAVARAVASQLALAERLWARTGWPEGIRAPERASYEPWRDRPGESAYEVPSYQQAGESVRVPVQQQLQPVETLAGAARIFVSNYWGWLGFDVKGAASGLVHYLDRDPTAYAFVRAVFDAIPSDVGDNVAAEFLDRIPDRRLHGFTLSAEGLAMLDVLYEAMITGSVSEFQRKQAERILRAKSSRTTQEAFVRSLEHLKIFPIRNFGWTREAYATFQASLQPDGKVWVRYDSVRLYQFEMFRRDRETLPGYSQTLHSGFELDPDEIVAVRLYDEGKRLVLIPALALIDYSNQMQRQTLGTAATAFFTGLTIGFGALGSAGVRALQLRVAAGEATSASLWAARAALWADRIAFAIPAGSVVINEHRDWILEQWPVEGRALLDVVDTANQLAGYYGWAQLGVGSLRFLSSSMRGALGAWRSARAAGAGPAKTSLLEGPLNKAADAVDAEAQGLVNEFTYAEERAAGGAAPARAADEPPAQPPARPKVRGARRPRLLQKPFMQWALNRILSDPRHPLRFLVDPRNRDWLARTHLSELPTVQAGHLVSHHSGAPEALALEDSFFNQASNWKGERFGAVFEKAAVDIGGIPVEVRTAEMWESLGVIQEGTVERAMRSAGWTGPP